MSADYLKLTPRTLRDISIDHFNPRQILAPQYRFVNDTVNLLTEYATLLRDDDGKRHTAVQPLIRGLANYIKEDNKYISLYPSGTSREAARLDGLVTREDTVAEARAKDAMRADMRMDGADM